jgi:ATP-binding cassette subfamily B protein/ATP-binding cassette subfamily C protein
MEKRQREGKRLPLPRTAGPVIEFRNVSFRYPNQERYTLKNINITIRGGEKLSIVGENGAGKTTFTKLLARFYRPTEGTIYLNGVDIQDYDYDQYAEMFSVLFQDFALFVMPLRDNITLGRNIGDKEIITALEQSGFKDRLARLEKGLDTPVYKTFDETGFEPSGGEGQKIAMARALLKGAPVVILDEPTAALDPRAEYEMYMRFNEMVHGKTAIFISHRLASVTFCVKVAVFKNGEIVDHGTHDELMKKQGLYHELFTMQAQFYSGEEG